MNIGEALKYSSSRLLEKIKNPHFEAELLLSIALSKAREFILTHHEYELSNNEMFTLNDLIDKRNDDMSIAYLSNSKSFYGLDFHVDENVLVPRPETEMMVDKAIDLAIASMDAGKRTVVADIGTGSGCIIISIAHDLDKRGLLADEKITLYAVDVSKNALSVARKNSAAYVLDDKIHFHNGSLLNPIQKILNDSTESLIICANLPYLTKEQIESSESIRKEPRLALDGGVNGMELYIELFKQIRDLKSQTGLSITLLAEIDHTQKDIFVKDCESILPKSEIEVLKDLGGYERLVLIKN